MLPVTCDVLEVAERLQKQLGKPKVGWRVEDHDANRGVPACRSLARLNPNLLFVSRGATEWCTRCMSGVTIMNHTHRSTETGNRPFEWLNIAVAFSRNCGLSHGRGQQDLDRVKSGARLDIEIDVGVMHPMQSPQHWHGMKQHMLKVDDEVEKDDRATKPITPTKAPPG